MIFHLHWFTCKASTYSTVILAVRAWFRSWVVVSNCVNCCWYNWVPIPTIHVYSVFTHIHYQNGPYLPRCRPYMYDRMESKITSQFTSFHLRNSEAFAMFNGVIGVPKPTGHEHSPCWKRSHFVSWTKQRLRAFIFLRTYKSLVAISHSISPTKNTCN